MNPSVIPVLLLAGTLLLQGCAAAGGAFAGASIVGDPRTAGTLVEDQAIELKALKAIAGDARLSEQAHINVTSYNTVVLLTGEVPDQALRRRAVELIRRIEKVRRVHNELAIAAPSSLMTRTSDSYITAKVKANLLALKGFNPLSVKVVTENGVVYLMGLIGVEDARRATEAARKVSGAQKIVKLFEYTD